jgi:hypothetical protein
MGSAASTPPPCSDGPSIGQVVYAHILSFFILHEILELQIIYHNNRVAACGQPLAFGSVLLGLVDFDFVREYFWNELG